MPSKAATLSASGPDAALDTGENVITVRDSGGKDITSREVGLMFLLGAAAFLVFFFILLAL